MRANLGLVFGAIAAVLGYGNGAAWAGDALVTLDSTNGSSSFIVRDADSNELACVQSDGKVGIGTASPGHKLTVEGVGDSNTGILALDVAGSATFNWASAAMAPNLDAGDQVIHMIGQAENGNNAGYVGFKYQGDGSANNLLTMGLFASDNILNITGGGKVGIGTDSPTERLTVNGMLAFVQSPGDEGNAGKIGYRVFDANSLDIIGAAIDGSPRKVHIWDHLGVGTEPVAYVFQVNGTAGGTSGWSTSSDARLKKDVATIEDALGIVQQLRGVTFNWDRAAAPEMAFDDRNHVGFIAQEVEVVLPQAVATANDERQTKSVAYSEIIPVLAEAIKQQQVQIEALKAEIETLKAN